MDGERISFWLEVLTWAAFLLFAAFLFE